MPSRRAYSSARSVFSHCVLQVGLKSKGLICLLFNLSTASAAYIRVFIFYWHIKYHILNMLKIKGDINQQDLKRVDLNFVKSV